MSVEQFKHLKKGDHIETELRSDKDRKIRMTGTVISKLKRKGNGKEFLIFKMDGNFIIGGYTFVTANEIIKKL